MNAPITWGQYFEVRALGVLAGVVVGLLLTAIARATRLPGVLALTSLSLAQAAPARAPSLLSVSRRVGGAHALMLLALALLPLVALIAIALYHRRKAHHAKRNVSRLPGSQRLRAREVWRRLRGRTHASSDAERSAVRLLNARERARRGPRADFFRRRSGDR